MEISDIEMQPVAETIDTQSDQIVKSKLNDSGSDLNETEKLQISSDLQNDDDDDDDEDIIVGTIRSNKKKKTLKILASDSEDEDKTNRQTENDELDEKDDDRSADGDRKNVYNYDEDDSRLSENNEQMKKISKDDNVKLPEPKYKALLDSDTESEAEDDTNPEAHLASEADYDSKLKVETTKRSDVPQRMSAKQAMDQMMSIKSETQRLYRENQVTIPYHRPKHFSLKEFMNRKTISKPNLNNPQKCFSLKMTHEQLKEFAKQLEEREKEATDFFKSDERKFENCADAESNPIPCKRENSNELKRIEIQNDDCNKVEVSEEKIEKNISEDQDQIIAESQDEIISETQENPSITDPQDIEVIESQVDSQQLLPETCESITIPETEESVQLAATEEIILPSSENLFDSQTGKLLKPSTTTSLSEALKERNIVESPSLIGSPDMFIDLETGDVVPPKLSGADKLFERFMKHSAKKKTKESSNVSIVSTENGKIEITNVNVVHNEEEMKEEKPRAAYFKLKDNLMKVIVKRRKEEIQKRIDENKGSDKENKEGYEEDFDEEDEEYFDEADEEYNDEEVEEPQQVEVDVNEEIKVSDDKEVEPEMDTDCTDADDEYDSDESDDNDVDDDDELNEDTKKIKTRIISALDDSDDEEKTETVGNIPNEINQPWTEEENRNPDEEEELLDLCSGRFGATQKNPIISQIPTTQVQDAPDENELLALCSGTFQDATQAQHPAAMDKVETSPKTAPRRLESSDEENEENPKPKEKTKQKKIRKLEFSDDEEEDVAPKNIGDSDDENDILDDLNEDSMHDVNDKEMPETYIDYDSEENEIQVEMTKTDRRKKATEFFENEAELSESEWGSADEDEKGMDRYDIDLADDEHFDKEKLRDELGKIHMRRMLDDDIRNVKKLQEMLIEDEETDGIGRERKFRWQFAAEDLDVGPSAENEDGLKDIDVEDEIEWRTMRYERELMLKQKGDKLDASDLSLNQKLSASSGKKITIVNTNASSTVIAEGSSPFLITKTMGVSRGSFLMRDSATLSRLANITKTGGDQETGAARAAKSNNFVFASIDVPDEEKQSLKRKSLTKEPEAIESSQRKKRKKIRLIDQLA